MHKPTIHKKFAKEHLRKSEGQSHLKVGTKPNARTPFYVQLVPDVNWKTGPPHDLNSTTDALKERYKYNLEGMTNEDF